MPWRVAMSSWRRARRVKAGLGRLTKRSEKQKVKLLQDALKEIPGHPILLVALGHIQVAMGDLRGAQVSLRQGWEAGRTNPSIVGPAMHDLLHAKGEATVEELLPSARSIPDLLAEFWVEQARQAIKCGLGEKWIDRFCQEALARSAVRHGDDSPAATFMAICDALGDQDAPAALRAAWEQRARAEAGHAGLGEFIDARGAAAAGNRRKALELLRKGRRLASKAKEQAAVDYFEEIEQLLNLARSPFAGLLDQLDPDLLLEILEDLDGGRRMKR